MRHDEWLAHYAVKGQKRGVRRYQMENGSYTKLGYERHKQYLAEMVGKAKSYNPTEESLKRNTTSPRATMTDIKGSINYAYKQASEARAKNTPRATVTNRDRIALANKHASEARNTAVPRAKITVEDCIQLAYKKASEGRAKNSTVNASNFSLMIEKLKHPIETGRNWFKHHWNNTQHPGKYVY